MEKFDINIAYNIAYHFTRSHYENFPVVSFLIKKDLQKHVAIVYQFARQADDIADEGNLASEDRILKLNNYRNELNSAIEGNPTNDFWAALSNTIRSKNLDPQNFSKLLNAFEQDITINRYSSFEV